ncbi:MAG TPA: hypothetical protein VK668_02345 [Mucilaginibacter sp.]|nr:hypothetical protein [Mucilaginibacter sp.]
MEINALIEKIIPPSDREHRDGFSNVSIIENLTVIERNKIEDALVNMLNFSSIENLDTLIVETLAYLKSTKSIFKLKDLLKKSNSNLDKLIIATSIFEISAEDEMLNVAVASFKNIDNKADPYYIYKLSDGFDYLIRFRNPVSTKIIQDYTQHTDPIISYNAKRALAKI